MTTTEDIFGVETIAILDADPGCLKRLKQANEMTVRSKLTAEQYDTLLLSTIFNCLLDNPAAFDAFSRFVEPQTLARLAQ